MLTTKPQAINQFVAPLIAILVAYFGYRIHERMRLQHYLSELRFWSSECLECLSEAVHLCDLEPAVTEDPIFYNRRHAILVQLSAKIDQGRWFFPNVKDVDLETWKLESYKTVKHRPLDDLVYCYGAVRKMSYTDRQENQLLRSPLVEIKRDFTSSIQILLDPTKAHKQFGLAMKRR